MRRPLRIVHVVHSLGVGGMENGVANVARALERSGDAEVHVVSLTREGEFATRFPAGRVTGLGKPEGFRPTAILALRERLRRLSPDVVHTHNLGPLVYGGPAAMGVAPVLHGEHASLTTAEQRPVALAKRRLLYTRAAAIHTVSEGMTRELESLGLTRRPILTVRNGVDTERFHPDADRAVLPSSWPEEALVVALVARFGAEKGHERLLDAWEEVRLRHPVRLVFVGSGGPREEAVRQRVASLPWADEVLFAGYQRDPVPWYVAADLLVLPSTNEGLSNMTLEAMACGRAVLTHEACGAREVIRDGLDGLVRDLSSVSRLTGELDSALGLRRSGLLERGAEARRTIRSRWSIDGMVAGYLGLYRGLAFPVAAGSSGA